MLRMSEQINKISNYVGVFVFGMIILIVFSFAIFFTIKMFIDIYRKLRGITISKTTSCRTCSRSISSTAVICPYCGEHFGELNGVTNSIVMCFFSALMSFVLLMAVLTQAVEWFESTFMK